MSSRPRPILIDLPLHIKKKIVHHVDVNTRFQLRNCSSEYRNIADNIPTDYTNVSFRYRKRSPDGAHDGYEFTVTTENSRFYRDFRDFSRVQSMDLFQKHLSRFLKNPKAEFEKFHCATAHFPYDQLNAAFYSSTQKLAVKNLSLKKCIHPNAEYLNSIFPYLKPGYLEHMDLGYISGYTNLAQITELEQFKQAKSAVIRGEALYIPIAKLLHLQRFECTYWQYLSVETVQTIIDNALRQGEKFERWELRTLNCNESIEDHFETHCTFNVPNSDHRLTFAHDGETFYLTNEARRRATDTDMFFVDF